MDAVRVFVLHHDEQTHKYSSTAASEQMLIGQMHDLMSTLDGFDQNVGEGLSQILWLASALAWIQRILQVVLMIHIKFAAGGCKTTSLT